MFKRKVSLILTVALAALLAFGSMASAESRIVLKPKVDAFAYFVDTSPSMSQTYDAISTLKLSPESTL